MNTISKGRLSVAAVAIAVLLIPSPAFGAVTPGPVFAGTDTPAFMTDDEGVSLDFCVLVPNGTPEVDNPLTPEDETHPPAECRAPVEGDEGGYQSAEGEIVFPGGGTALLIMEVGFHPAEDGVSGALEAGYRVRLGFVATRDYLIRTAYGNIEIPAGQAGDVRGTFDLGGVKFFTQTGQPLVPGAEQGSGQEGVPVAIDQPVVVLSPGLTSRSTNQLEIGGQVHARDDVPPAAPAQMTVTRTSTTTARLSWPAVQGATQYQVRRITGQNPPAEAIFAPQTARTFNINVGSIVNRYYVRAIDATGNESAYSVVRVVGRPGQPVVTAVRAGAIGGSVTASVSWRAPVNNGNAITSYRVTAIRASNGARTTVIVSGSARSATVSGLIRNNVYRFQIQAVNGFGPGPLSALSARVTAR